MRLYNRYKIILNPEFIPSIIMKNRLLKKALFIDRDGTIIVEPLDNFQVDSLEKLEFIPGVIRNLSRIAYELDFELVLVTNQDGLGTEVFPEDNFWPAHNKMIQLLENEGVKFKAVHIDRSLPGENKSTRKPGIGMLKEYLNGDYDLSASYVIGDRLTDIQLASNLGAKAILLRMNTPVSPAESNDELYKQFTGTLDYITTLWDSIYNRLRLPTRHIIHRRKTTETDILVEINLDGTGRSEISTGIGFFDHMLDQIARHGNLDLKIQAKGDLHVDEHHTIEDTGIALGEAFSLLLADKHGLQRYGFCLPMDDSLAHVAIDFGGRNYIVWEAEFNREKVGDMPTEMFFHFFKSFSDAAKCNLNIQVEGHNEHHKIEAIFKAFSRAIRMAVKRDATAMILPTTKGVL